LSNVLMGMREENPELLENTLAARISIGLRLIPQMQSEPN
jgi:hypothetical protein